jgi:hypothetical protein
LSWLSRSFALPKKTCTIKSELLLPNVRSDFLDRKCYHIAVVIAIIRGGFYMAEFKVGDPVQVVMREVTGEDVKSSLYFTYFGGLIGKVDRIYDDGTVCVDIDLDSLTHEARKRHLDTQEAERKRWLESLSGEARNRLTEDQKKLKISYKILVSKKDLVPCKGGKPKPIRNVEEAASGEDFAARHEGPARAPDPDDSAMTETETLADEPRPKRLSEADLAANEEEFLRSLQQRPSS